MLKLTFAPAADDDWFFSLHWLPILPCHADVIDGLCAVGWGSDVTPPGTRLCYHGQATAVYISTATHQH